MWGEVRVVLEYIYLIGGVLGIPAAVVVFYLQQRQRIQLEKARLAGAAADRYSEVNNVYLEYLRLCASHPMIMPTNWAEGMPQADLSPAESYKRQMLFHYFVSMVERAYWYYHKGEKYLNDDVEWPTWRRWICDQFNSAEFRRMFDDFAGSSKVDHYGTAVIDELGKMRLEYDRPVS